MNTMKYLLLGLSYTTLVYGNELLVGDPAQGCHVNALTGMETCLHVASGYGAEEEWDGQKDQPPAPDHLYRYINPLTGMTPYQMDPAPVENIVPQEQVKTD